MSARRPRMNGHVLSPYTVFALWDEATDEPVLIIEDEEWRRLDRPWGRIAEDDSDE